MENLRITESIKANLLTAMKWMKFLTVVSIIGLALVALAAVVLPMSGIPQAWLMSLIYIVAIAIYVYPIKKCLNIISSTRKAMNEASQAELEDAADSFRSVLKYMGILCIIVLSIYALLLLCVIIALASGLMA